MAGGGLTPSSIYLGGASGNLSPQFYIPSVNTNTAGALEGVQVVGSLGANAPCVLQFNAPEVIPAGVPKLRALAMANSSSGVAKYTPTDGQTPAGSNIGATTLAGPGVQTVTWAVAGDVDILKETKSNLNTSTITANDIITVLVTFNNTGWTLTQTSVWQFSLVWE